MGLILLIEPVDQLPIHKTKEYESIDLKPPNVYCNVYWTTSTFTYVVKVFSNIRSKYYICM